MKKEITENNKLIAGFMGKEIYQHIHESNYHCSWDWLMSVVEKIEKIDDGKYDVAILQDGTQIMIWDTRTKIVDITNALVYFETKIEATYKAVVEFIKWYNENK